MSNAQIEKMMAFVAECGDAKKLRQIAKNADEKGISDLAHAARRKLYSILPGEDPNTIEYAVWRSIFALEDTLKQERGKAILLARTRQKIGRQGVTQCVADLVQGAPSEGFKMLLERDMLDLSFEAVALKFPDKFEPNVLSAAEARLKEAGYNYE